MKTEPEKRLIFLLQSKSFSELTLEERTFVLSIVSEEKFEHYRKFVGIEEIPLGLNIEELTLRSEVKDTVLAAFKQKHKKEKISPFLTLDFFKKRQVWIRVPLAFGVLALIGILIFKINQNNKHLIVEGPVVSDVMETNEDDSVKRVEIEPSISGDSSDIPENIIHPKWTLEPEQKERINPEAIRNNPEIIQASITKNELEISIEEMDKFIGYAQAGMNERLIVPETVVFEDGGELLVPGTYENFGL